MTEPLDLRKDLAGLKFCEINGYDLSATLTWRNPTLEDIKAWCSTNGYALIKVVPGVPDPNDEYFGTSPNIRYE